MILKTSGKDPKEFIIDDEDYDKIKDYKWYSNKHGQIYRSKYNKLTKKNNGIFLHRKIITGIKKSECIDHINHNCFDNRKINLRICSFKENKYNVTRYKNNKSGYKGIDFYKPYKKWRARITKDYKQIFIGFYDNKEDAKYAYNKKAELLFGDFAYLN